MAYSCSSCGGLGSLECTICEGDGIDPATGEECTECDGDGEIDCEECTE